MPNTILTKIIFAFIIAIPLVMVVAGQVAEVMVLIAAILVLFKDKDIVFKINFKNSIATCLYLLFLIILLHSFNDPSPMHTYFHLTKIILLFVCTSVVGLFFIKNADAEFFKYFAFALIISSIIAVLILIYARLYIPKFHFFHFNRLAITNALLLLPTLYFIKEHRKIFITTSLCVMILAAFSVSSTAVVALIFAFLGFFFVLIFPKTGLNSLILIFIASFLFAPWLGQLPLKIVGNLSFMKSSGYHRLDIWDAYSTLAQIKPLWGWGFDASRFSFFNEDIRSLFVKPDDKLAAHPHFQQLQIWFELGCLAAITMVSIVILMWKNLSTWQRQERAIAAGSLAAILVTITVNFSIWQLWFLAIVGIQVIFVLAVNAHRSR